MGWGDDGYSQSTAGLAPEVIIRPQGVTTIISRTGYVNGVWHLKSAVRNAHCRLSRMQLYEIVMQLKVPIMPNDALIQTPIDEGIKERANANLEKSGPTVSDALSITLTRTANEGVFPMDFALRIISSGDFDTWFRAKVQEALDDPCSPIPHEEVERHFVDRRSALKAKL